MFCALKEAFHSCGLLGGNCVRSFATVTFPMY